MNVTVDEFGPCSDLNPPNEGAIHLWLTDLDQPEPELARLSESLIESEHRRAERFRLPHLRRHFTVGRGMVRHVLGHCLGMPPRQVPIEYEPNGKPTLPPEFGDWQFNLSHSEGKAVLAVTRGRRLGVDLERVRPIPNMVGMVERFFATGERQQFAEVPDIERPDAFFNGWTRKEALIKARGATVVALELFEVTLTGSPRLLSWQGEPDACQRWQMWSASLGEGFVTCVAIEK